MELAVLTGVVLAYVMFIKYLPFKNFPDVFSAGFTSALNAIANTCIVVGFGSVVKEAPAFTWLTENIDKIPGPALVGVALSVTLICGLTHKEGYFPVFMLTVVLPCLGTALATSSAQTGASDQPVVYSKYNTYLDVVKSVSEMEELFSS